MIREITLHGIVGDEIDYYATVAGKDLEHRYFFERLDSNTERFFFSGKEFVVDVNGIKHKGNGGSFCEDMFGVNQPLSDLLRPDVLNRLAMYGTASGDSNDTGLSDIDRLKGAIPFDRIFLEGHAVSNYFFFVDIKLGKNVKDHQEDLVKLIGKTLKHSEAIGMNDDSTLMSELIADLDGFDPVIFILRLRNLYNERYYELVKESFYNDKKIEANEEALLNSIAVDLGINSYQRERIKLDVMYKYPGNKRILEDYRRTIAKAAANKDLSENVKIDLEKLRALAIKNNLPLTVFDTLDDSLQSFLPKTRPGKEVIQDTKSLLEDLLGKEGTLIDIIGIDGLLKLLFDKQKSMETMDKDFENILLDMGRICDEKARDDDFGPFERFSELLTYFDRFENTMNELLKLSFSGVDFEESRLRSINGNRLIFNEIKTNLFNELYFDGILKNKYLSTYGRKRIMFLKDALTKADSEVDLKTLAVKITGINAEEKQFQQLYETAKERMQNIPGAIKKTGEHDKFVKDVVESLKVDAPIDHIAPDLLDKISVALKMEMYYLSDMLPKLVDTIDVETREDFIQNGVFDRFYVEDIERAFLENSDLEPKDIERFKSAIAA